MVVLSQQICPSEKVMPGLQEGRSPANSGVFKPGEFGSRVSVYWNGYRKDTTTNGVKPEFNHPNVPSNNSEELHNSCFSNQGYETDEDIDEDEEILADRAFQSPILANSAHPDSNMTTAEEQSQLDNLYLPEEEQWLETERNAFIARRIQDIVQSFHQRTEKAKEKLIQPPTPSPSPPPDTSSENEMTPVHKPRPRLQSLIEDDKCSVGARSLNKDLFCCTVKKSWLPSFPKIIDPQSKLYISWLFLVMVSYSYNAWSIILLAVFPYQTPKNIPFFLAFDYIADLIYLLDIVVFKVRLQFLRDGFWVEDFKRTKANYFRKREFKLDILSLLPLDLLYFVYGINPLFRLPRFLKVQTFWEFFNRVDAVTKTPYVIRIIRTLMYMMYLIHLNACAYYAMSLWEGIGSNKWVFQGEGNAYIRCFYFATKTATSIGKNPKPQNEIEYIFMTISWLMGVFIFAFLVGQIRDIVATATQGRTQYRQLMDQTVMYMRNLNLPEELQRRVRMWLNHNWEQQKTFDVSRILDTLPRKMKTDIAINVHYKTLVKVQLFKDCDKALLRDLVLQLRPVLFLPGDYICRKGEVGKEMYIVNKGMVEVLGGEKGDVVLATLTKGSVFGEISLLGIPGCNRRTADVRSKGFSNLFVLGKDDLWEALKNYPEAQKVLRKKAKNIIKENEARARANRPRTEEVPQKREPVRKEPPASTPKLVRTVMQLLPKTGHRVQPETSTPITGLFTNNTREYTCKNSPNTNHPNGSERMSSSAMENQTQSSRPINSPTAVKQRSMSVGTIPNQVQYLKDKHDIKTSKEQNSNPSLPRPSSAKSEPCYRGLRDSPDSMKGYLRPNSFSSKSRKIPLRSNSTSHRYHPFIDVDQNSAKQRRSYERLSWPQEHLPPTLNNRNRGEYYIHLPDESSESEPSSEMFSSSTQKTAMDNSDEDNSNLCWTSSSSSIPFLGELFQQESMSNVSTDKAGMTNSIPASGEEKINNNPESSESIQNLATDNSGTSSTISTPCLSNLFRSESSNHSSMAKDLPLSPIIKHEEKDSSTRPGSSTSGSSIGYDNLAFIPTGLLSRRSSLFSDISG